MQLDPRGGVDQQRERERVRFGEPEVGERLNLLVDRIGLGPDQAVRGHARIELLAQRLDALDPALRAHGSAQQVGVFSRAVADGHRHLHQLLLKHGDAEGALQHRLELWVRVRHLFLPELAPHERVHGTTLDGPRPDQGDLNHEVVEPPRLQARQQPHLRARFDLKDPDRIGPAQHVVDPLLLLRNRRELPHLPRGVANEIETVLQGRQHPEP